MSCYEVHQQKTRDFKNTYGIVIQFLENSSVRELGHQCSLYCIAQQKLRENGRKKRQEKLLGSEFQDQAHTWGIKE